MMKVRIKKTGEIINIADYARVVLDKCDSYGNPIEVGFDEVEIIQDNPSNIDWEQRRYEIAKECVVVLMRNEMTLEDAAKISVEQADALIAELKKGDKK
jgi:hypothetical protein